MLTIKRRAKFIILFHSHYRSPEKSGCRRLGVNWIAVYTLWSSQLLVLHVGIGKNIDNLISLIKYILIIIKIN